MDDIELLSEMLASDSGLEDFSDCLRSSSTSAPETAAPEKYSEPPVVAAAAEPLADLAAEIATLRAVLDEEVMQLENRAPEPAAEPVSDQGAEIAALRAALADEVIRALDPVVTESTSDMVAEIAALRSALADEVRQREIDVQRTAAFWIYREQNWASEPVATTVEPPSDLIAENAALRAALADEVMQREIDVQRTAAFWIERLQAAQASPPAAHVPAAEPTADAEAADDEPEPELAPPTEPKSASPVEPEVWQAPWKKGNGEGLFKSWFG